MSKFIVAKDCHGIVDNTLDLTIIWVIVVF